jgi:hypothetical protein
MVMSDIDVPVLDNDGDVCVPDHLPDPGAVPVTSPPSLLS